MVFKRTEEDFKKNSMTFKVLAKFDSVMTFHGTDWYVHILLPNGTEKQIMLTDDEATQERLIG